MQFLTRILFLALFLLGSFAAQASGFLTISDDLPLPPELTEITGAGLVFDAPGGRISQAYARGSLRPDGVMRFYAATLPQLGWVRESDLTYSRDAEKLRIDITPQGAGVLVHFTLSPE